MNSTDPANTTDQSPRQPKAVVFDLLTALLDSWTLWDQSTPSGTHDEGMLWRQRYLEVTFGTNKYVPYESLVAKAAQDVGLPSSAPEALLANWRQLKPWPEVPGVLERLKAKGYKLGVVTNCSVRLGRIAAHQAGQGIFDAVVTGEESGYYKPTAEAYRAILEPLGVEAKDVLFVAGSAGDVAGATRAGMKVVWHNKIGLPARDDVQPMREATTLDEALVDFL
ncbi:hypothetical protein VHEMI06778 [[Torrubiella] hemipterigena]|uniref:Haloacid dehalogenase n=1 Tax=[Torrubiella] hemipterigena TaxID=1531966 RepID=A0A0A1TK89_9HYPO|nr:hypothetical protein VHEMI06778 [[Torrubiella] hemipterigena]